LKASTAVINGVLGKARASGEKRGRRNWRQEADETTSTISAGEGVCGSGRTAAGQAAALAGSSMRTRSRRAVMDRVKRDADETAIQIVRGRKS